MNRRFAGRVVAAAILATVLVLAGCDFPQFRENLIEYQGAEFEAGNLYAVDYGVNGSGYDVRIYLTEPTLTIASDGSLSGVGTYAWVEIHIASETLQEGEFSWQDGPDRILGRLHDGAVEVNYPDGLGLVPIIFGSAIVGRADVTNEWIVELTLQTGSGDVEAYYRGDLTDSISASIP